MASSVRGRPQVYLPLCLNCGLSVAPWFFTKAMRPVAAHLRGQGHRIFSYLDDFFGALRSSILGLSTVADTVKFGQEMKTLFRRLGLSLHRGMCDFSGTRRLEILGILVGTERAMFVLSAEKLRKVEQEARRLLRYASQHKRRLRVSDIHRFAGISNSLSPAVVYARLHLRELFDAVKVCHQCHHPLRNLSGKADMMSRVT